MIARDGASTQSAHHISSGNIYARPSGTDRERVTAIRAELQALAQNGVAQFRQFGECGDVTVHCVSTRFQILWWLKGEVNEQKTLDSSESDNRFGGNHGDLFISDSCKLPEGNGSILSVEE